jgi:hypothetical protein
VRVKWPALRVKPPALRVISVLKIHAENWLSAECGWSDPHCGWRTRTDTDFCTGKCWKDLQTAECVRTQIQCGWVIRTGWFQGLICIIPALSLSPTSFLYHFKWNFCQERRKRAREFPVPLKPPIVARNRNWNRVSARESLPTPWFGILFSPFLFLNLEFSRFLRFSF